MVHVLCWGMEKLPIKKLSSPPVFRAFILLIQLRCGRFSLAEWVAYGRENKQIPNGKEWRKRAKCSTIIVSELKDVSSPKLGSIPYS